MATQESRVLGHLKKNGTITNAQAHNLYGIRHLPSIIRNIKKHTKYSITDWWEEGVNRFSEKCRWKVYAIDEQQTA